MPGKRGVRPADFGTVADPVRPVAVDQQPRGERRAVVIDLIELMGVLRVGDHHLEFTVADPVLDVLRGQQGRGGALHRAELDQRQ